MVGPGGVLMCSLPIFFLTALALARFTPLPSLPHHAAQPLGDASRKPLGFQWFPWVFIGSSWVFYRVIGILVGFHRVLVGFGRFSSFFLVFDLSIPGFANFGNLLPLILIYNKKSDWCLLRLK